MAATMTFVVEYVWSGKKPGIFKRKFYESEFARVNNWLKRRTASEPTEVSKLKELIQAYALVNPDLRMTYDINVMGELIGTTPEGDGHVSYQLGRTV